jgi:hypothetical protein
MLTLHFGVHYKLKLLHTSAWLNLPLPWYYLRSPTLYYIPYHHITGKFYNYGMEERVQR